MYWFSCWCRYWGHSGVRLYSNVFGWMVKIECISLCVSRIFGAWWLGMNYVCGGGVFFGGHSYPMDSFYGGFMVRWVH